jgi:hypothetical protein
MCQSTFIHFAGSYTFFVDGLMFGLKLLSNAGYFLASSWAELYDYELYIAFFELTWLLSLTAGAACSMSWAVLLASSVAFDCDRWRDKSLFYMNYLTFFKWIDFLLLIEPFLVG